MMHQRGAALSTVILTALTCAIAAYMILMVALSQARRATFAESRMENRYLAEAGEVFARERLWGNPAYAGGTVQIDTDGDGAGDTPVTVTISGSTIWVTSNQ